MSDNPEAPQVNPNFAQVTELMRQYGSIALIPDDELVGVGYVRHGDGHIAPAGQEVVSMDATTGFDSLEEKSVNKPFEPFTIAVDTKNSNKHISKDLLRNFERVDWKISQILQGEGKVLAHSIGEVGSYTSYRALSELAYDMAWKTTLSDDEESDIDGRRRFRYGGSWQITDSYPRVLPDYILKSETKGSYFPERAGILDRIPYMDLADLEPGLDWEDMFDIHDNTPAKLFVQNILTVLERERGRTTDIVELYKAWDEALEFDIPLKGEKRSSFIEFGIESLEQSGITEEELPKEMEKIYQYIDDLAALGVTTAGQLYLHMIGEVLDSYFPSAHTESFSQAILENQGTEDAAKWLNDLKTRLNEINKAELKDAKRSLKGLDVGTPNRTDAEQRIRAAKEAMKEVAKRLDPMISVFERPHAVVKALNRHYDDLRDLVTISEKTGIDLTFVSNVDLEKDRNPGAVSGDCTENDSLPFLDPSNRLFNVKVMRNEVDHVGNIYLLEVVDNNGEPLAWHLDAIQIPLYVDWDETSQKIIEGLQRKAEERGVEAITINAEGNLISNYDYIAGAFNRRAKKSVSLTEDSLGRKIIAAVTSVNTKGTTKLQALSTGSLQNLI